MPPLVITLVIAVILGLFAPRRIALAVTAVAGVLTVVAHIWAVADGRGNDPGWLIPFGAGGAVVAIVLCERLSAARQRRVAAPRS